MERPETTRNHPTDPKPPPKPPNKTPKPPGRRCVGRRCGVFLSSERSSSRRRRRELREGERGEPGCRRRRQTGSPSELRYEIQLVSCQAGVPQHGMGELGASYYICNSYTLKIDMGGVKYSARRGNYERISCLIRIKNIQNI